MIHETYKMTVLSPKETKNTCLQYLKNVYLRLVMPKSAFLLEIELL